MELILMEGISQNEINGLVNNLNTGIEYEYSLFYLLNNWINRKRFIELIVNKRIDRDKIFNIIDNTDTSILTELLHRYSWENYDVLLSTQEDKIGPSDIVIIQENNKLGLSVKFNNDCKFNCSSKYFLNEDSIKEIKVFAEKFYSQYIDEMNELYKHPNNWFRKRKSSENTDKYIDMIRDYVIKDWSLKKDHEIIEILSKFYHLNSPIPFWVVKFLKTKNKHTIDVNVNPIHQFLPENITISKLNTSHIAFYSKGEIFAKLQVKFNNGILESSKNNSFDFNVNGTKMKKGDPFGSWNFG